MALRLIEMVLKEKETIEMQNLLKEYKIMQHREIDLGNGETLVRILLDSEKNEKVLNALEEKYTKNEETRAIILPVEATLPRLEPSIDEKKGEPERISREELYEDIKDAARCSKVYLTMVVLSTVVAAVGLHYNNVVVIIGAMVIAPLIGPSMALSLATTLGDLSLLRKAVFTSLAGIGITVALSSMIGSMINLDVTGAQVASRTHVNIGDVTVALASGCAGALAFTKGISAILIGVMVAVALLPPLAVFGMLLGNGHASLAFGALSLFLMNMICINLSGVITFLVQGIRPASIQEERLAKRAKLTAIVLWALLLLALGYLLSII